ncbi:MAG: peptide chain release factor N(5)-glutamine methyltransferase [Lachnospiraceae bacterium]|nr:peptide chain release factor N(5)-glutamine methyltransferase [Lachnospiraceae bacterium]
MNYRECYKRGVAELEKNGVPEPENDAALLLEYVCGTNRNTLLAHGDTPVEEVNQRQYEDLIAKRSNRIPLQILTGEQDFCGLTFQVNEHVLIPRQDTEILVEQALKVLKPGMHLLDMCTGSGCILISLLAMSKKIYGEGVDISEKALQVAKANALRLLPEDKQPKWHCGDLFAALPTETTFPDEYMAGRVCIEFPTFPFDVIVSNPPYIPSAVIDTLMPEVKDYEPRGALDGSEDGLLFYKRIVKEGAPFLLKDGFLLFEIGHDQGEAVKAIMEAGGFENVSIIKDYAGLDRVVIGQKTTI